MTWKFWSIILALKIKKKIRIRKTTTPDYKLMIISKREQGRKNSKHRHTKHPLSSPRMFQEMELVRSLPPSVRVHTNFQVLLNPISRLYWFAKTLQDEPTKGSNLPTCYHYDVQNFTFGIHVFSRGQKQTNKQTRNPIFVLTFVPAMIFWLILAAILVARFSLARKDTNKKSITKVLAYFLILEIRWIKIKIWWTN